MNLSPSTQTKGWVRDGGIMKEVWEAEIHKSDMIQLDFLIEFIIE